ncbi:MAG: hypothetical protein M1587_11365 [Thaumarchaeota archaeon]|nr:hypothetical protein [Nitrososphaerota archaeon]
MADTARRKHVDIYLPMEMYEAVVERMRQQSFETLSQLGVKLFGQWLETSGAVSDKKENGPPTWEEERDKVVSQMARIVQTLGNKRDVMSWIVGKKLGLSAKNEKEVERNAKALWLYIVRKDGTINYRGKVMGIEKDEVDLYQKLGELHFKKIKIISEQAKIDVEATVSTS